MTFPHSIFKAYDIRGIVDETLTLEITHQIGQSVGSEVIANGGNSIVIGRDGRLSGPALSEALANGFQFLSIPHHPPHTHTTHITMGPSIDLCASELLEYC